MSGHDASGRGVVAAFLATKIKSLLIGEGAQRRVLDMRGGSGVRSPRAPLHENVTLLVAPHVWQTGPGCVPIRSSRADAS
jgi:hypothetical protein